MYGDSTYWYNVGGHLPPFNYNMPWRCPLVARRSTTNITRAESTFSSFWQSAETATPSFTFSTTDGIPILTTTSVANPIVSTQLYLTSITGGQLNGLWFRTQMPECQLLLVAFDSSSDPTSSVTVASWKYLSISGVAIAVIVCSTSLVLLSEELRTIHSIYYSDLLDRRSQRPKVPVWSKYQK